MGFINQEDVFLLTKQLKEIFSVEPRIVASPNGNSSEWRLVKEGNYFYKFVKEVRHINELCPMLPRMVF